MRSSATVAVTSSCAARGGCSVSTGRARRRAGPAHLAAFLLEDELLELLLDADPAAAAARDAAGRTPLHYAAHATERLRGLVYLFSPQPFATWLQRRSRSKLEFAPPVPARTLAAELAEAEAAAAAVLLRRGADAAAADAAGVTPAHLAAEGGSVALLRLLHCAGGASLSARATARAATRCSPPPRAGRPRRSTPPQPAGGRERRGGGRRAELARRGGRRRRRAAPVVGGGAGRAVRGRARRRVDAEPRKLRRRYAAQGRPVFVGGATAGWGAALLEAPSFLAAYGGSRWQPQMLLDGNATTLAPYMRKRRRRPLLFNRPVDPAELERLRREVAWPAAFTHPRVVASGSAAGLDFFVGPNGSGLPMHYHGAVWNALVWGRKLWALRRPADAVFAPSRQHPLDSEWWRRRAEEEGDGGATLMCEQAAGEALFLPPQWAHATVSLEPSLSVGAFLQDARALGPAHAGASASAARGACRLRTRRAGVGSLANAAVLSHGCQRSRGWRSGVPLSSGLRYITVFTRARSTSFAQTAPLACAPRRRHAATGGAARGDGGAARGSRPTPRARRSRLAHQRWCPCLGAS